MPLDAEDEHTCLFFKRIVSESADAVIAVDADQKVVFFNASAERLFGYSREEVLDKPLDTLLPLRFRAGHADKVRHFQSGDLHARYMGDRKSHIVGLRSDGTEVMLGAAVLKVENDGQTYMVAIARDISERVRLQEELTRMASADPLTGALNRRAFLATLAKEQSRAVRYESHLSLLMFDLDGFKGINDTYGHDVGDQVICRFSDLAQSLLRDIDAFGRWGGEEFIAALPHSDRRSARNVAERIREAIAGNTFEPEGSTPFSVTVSVGVADSSNGRIPHEQLIKWADYALYEAKDAGRNQVVIWSGMGAIRAVGDGFDD